MATPRGSGKGRTLHHHARGSEGVIDAAEDCCLAAPVAHIDVTYDVRARHPAKAQADGGMHVGEQIAGTVGEHLAGVDEGRNLDRHVRAEGFELRDADAQLRASGQHVLVHKSVGTIRAQWFAAVGHAAIAAEARECPERGLDCRRHVARTQVPGERDAIAEWKVAARFATEKAIGDRAAEAAARKAGVEKIARPAVRDERGIACVAGQCEGLFERVLGAEAVDGRVQGLDRGYAAQHPGQHLDAPPARAPGKLQFWREVISDGSLEGRQVLDVGALVIVGRLVADTEKACSADAVIDGLDRPGERRDASLPGDVARIEGVLDALLEVTEQQPLRVL